MHNFEVKGKIGEGSFAAVYKVRRIEDGIVYAMKRIAISNTSKREVANCLNEVRILASINNPYIVRYKEAFYDEDTKMICLVTELADGGDLNSLIAEHRKTKEVISQKDIWRIAIQTLHGLKTLHRMNIFHRDIKGANLLLNRADGTVKLADMNVSKISKNGLASTQTGTPYYTSPQVWNNMPYNGKCDIWSLGCVLYELAALRLPFLAKDITELRKKILSGHYERIPSCFSEELESFIRMCLEVNSKDRLNAEELLHTTFIRKRLYLYPNDKFNHASLQRDNKENKLLETIKLPSKYSFGQLKRQLPKSEYDIDLKAIRGRNSSFEEKPAQSPIKLPGITSRHAVRSSRKDLNLQKQRLLYLR